MTVYIILTIAGANVGPFDLYSDVHGYAVAFETGISRAQLVAGYLSIVVPEGTTSIKVQSTGDCDNYIIFQISVPTTTTTTTGPTTTTTTTITPSTTTTTTQVPVYIYLGTSITYNSLNDACAGKTCSRSYYRDIPVIADGLILYDDYALTTPFNGADKWMAVNNEVGGCSSTWSVMQVGVTGIISNQSICP